MLGWVLLINYYFFNAHNLYPQGTNNSEADV